MENNHTKKNLLLTAAGTATTWHFCKVIEQYFPDQFNIHLSDTNDACLVPASLFTKNFHKIPSVFEAGYLDAMYRLLEENSIDIIIPLIDFDLFNFPKDSEKLRDLKVVSTAPPLRTSRVLTDKSELYNFLTAHDLPTPRLFDLSEIDVAGEYILKPKKGFGSIDVEKLSGAEIKRRLGLESQNSPETEMIIQEVCDSPELTVEVFSGENLYIFQRERVATKAGVCVKMIPVHYPEIDDVVKKLVSLIECPEAFCLQFRQNSSKKWCLFDCNLRIGAGSALSTKIGFQLTRALLSSLAGIPPTADLFQVDPSIKSVLRVYDEVAVR